MITVQWIFRIAALYGLIVLIPGLFTETQMQPVVTHPELYYGFFGSALVWQLMFLLISTDPARYRALIPVAVLEKAAFFFPCIWLWHRGRIAQTDLFWGAMVDGVLMLAFILAWWAMRGTSTGDARS
jgi:hypothetical protein